MRASRSDTAGGTAAPLGPRAGRDSAASDILDPKTEIGPRSPRSTQGPVDVAPVRADGGGEVLDGEPPGFQVCGERLGSAEHGASVSPSVYRVKGEG